MTSSSKQTAEANYLWGHLIAQGLADLGITTVFFSPGSRSTPLIIGCEKEQKLSCFPVLDERSAAFLALGHAKRTRLPVALICTSGSALTHWFPAVTEASYSGIPLFLLSADRPPELQECGAGQTINQSPFLLWRRKPSANYKESCKLLILNPLAGLQDRCILTFPSVNHSGQLMDLLSTSRIFLRYLLLHFLNNPNFASAWMR